MLGELFLALKLPEVLGELFAGIIFGPYTLGSAIQIYGTPLVEFNDIVFAIAEIGAIVILFVAGLEMTFARFKAVGIPSFMVGTSGVILSFALGYITYTMFGYSFNTTILLGATLTATSIPITVRILEELGKMNDMESRIMINAAVIDDVLALVTLAIITSIIKGAAFSYFEIFSILLKTIIIWLVFMTVSAYVIPHFVRASTLLKAEGSVRAIAIALCFGLAALASGIGLSPLMGAFTAGMAIAGSRAIAHVKEFTSNIKLIFSPIFFGVMGAAVNISKFSLNTAIMMAILVVIAFVSKLVGCGLPAAIYLKDRAMGLRVGIGMISRGEVGIMIASIGLTAGILTEDIYLEIIGMVIATTILTPMLLKLSLIHKTEAGKS